MWTYEYALGPDGGSAGGAQSQRDYARGTNHVVQTLNTRIDTDTIQLSGPRRRGRFLFAVRPG
jgi:hypothetical protein